MTDTTDTQEQGPLSEDAAVDWLLSPEQSDETEVETDEAPAEPTDPVEAEEDADAPDEAEEYEGEAEAEYDGDDDPDDADDEEDADENEQPDDTRFTVKVDGQDVEVTLDELKRGYSGQAYIQQGMERNKEYQRQLAEAAQAMKAERDTLLQMYQQAQQTGFVPAPQPPDAQLADSDPVAYMQQRAKYDHDLQAYQQQQAQIQQFQQRQQQQTQAEMQQELARQMEVLKERIPEFGDAKKAPELRKKLMEGAQKAYGFNEQELGSIVDARAIQVLNDAIAYRELQSGKKAAQKPREQPKSVTGKAPARSKKQGRRANAQKALNRAKQTQSGEDWANVLLQPLD